MRRRTILLTILISAFLLTVPGFAQDGTRLSVVFNELSWAGAAWDPTAEWIELFNTTDEAIDLEGWQIVSSDKAPTIRLQGIIDPSIAGDPSAGFFLLERDSDDSVPGIDADLIYRGALSDGGETLTLLDASGRIVDTVNATLTEQGTREWPAGTDEQGSVPYVSMERITFREGDTPSNWATALIEDAEASASAVLGTPHRENSVYNEPPTASFTITPQIPHPGEVATFDAGGSLDSNDPIATYLWDLGDGSVATGKIITHTYEDEGVYSIILVVTDSKGGQSILTQKIEVGMTTPPRVDFSIITNLEAELVRVGDLVRFQDESTDPDSQLASWDWDFGDETQGEGRETDHVYETFGDFVITLRVTDTQGEAAQQTQSLTVASLLPVAAFAVSPELPDQSEAVRFDATPSTDADGEIVSYGWDFEGDGTIDIETAEATIVHQYETSGTFTPRLVVTDDQGGTTEAERVLVVNAGPTAQFRASNFTPRELDVVTFTDLSTDRDGDLVQWSWNFGDGATSVEAAPTHAYQRSGTWTVTLTVTDDAGATAQATASITVMNLSPIANLTAAATTLPTGSTFTFDASASNDPSPSGSLTRYEWSLGGDDFDFETSVPTLAHAFAENGTVQVRVRVTDSSGESAVSAPLAITVTNRAPTASSVSWFPEDPVDGETVTFSVVSSDSDGSVTFWTWTVDSEAPTTTTETLVTAFHDNESYTVTIVVRDNDGASSQPYAVSVPILNAAPVAAFTSAQISGCDGQLVRFNATDSYDPSPNGTIVHVAWDFGDGTYCPGTSSNCAETDRWTPEHCYSEPGTYIVTLVVIDENGAMSSTQKSIFIEQ